MNKKRAGFTLLEMIIVIAITSLVIGIVTSIFMTGNKVFADSDVKTDLQIGAKDIQERISKICMEAAEIKSVNSDGSTDKINSISFISYDYEYNDNLKKEELKEKSFSIEKTNDGKMKINNYIIPSNVKSIAVNKNIIEESKKDNPDYSRFYSIQFEVVLEGKKGFSQKIEYPINFTVTFRNK